MNKHTPGPWRIGAAILILTASLANARPHELTLQLFPFLSEPDSEIVVPWAPIEPLRLYTEEEIVVVRC